MQQTRAAATHRTRQADKERSVRYNPTGPGPYCANLTVTDDIGMTATSDYISIPADSKFSPAVNFNTVFNPILSSLNVTILDINGVGMSDTAVNYIVEVNQFGNLTLSNYVGTTDSHGNSSSLVNGTGTIKIVSGEFSREVAVNGVAVF